MKSYSIRLCARAPNVITCTGPRGCDTTSSVPSTRFALINKQFSVAFHCCQMSLSDVNARQKLETWRLPERDGTEEGNGCAGHG